MRHPREIKIEKWGKVIHFACPKGHSDLYFEICSIEKLYSYGADIDAAITPHCHDFYQLIFCVEGDGFHVLDFDKMKYVAEGFSSALQTSAIVQRG